MSIKIKLAPSDFNDWSGLLRLLCDSFEYMNSRIDPPSSLLSMGVDELRVKATEENLIIAMEGKNLVGCVFAAIRDDCVYVGKLAVAASARGEGIARAMMDAAENLARRHNRSCLELQTRVELIENHATFSALGFTKVSESAHLGYSRTTSITMRRPVGNGTA